MKNAGTICATQLTRYSSWGKTTFEYINLNIKLYQNVYFSNFTRVKNYADLFVHNDLLNLISVLTCKHTNITCNQNFCNLAIK